MKFFRNKLDKHLKTLENDFQDTQSDRLSSEDMYTQQEIETVLNSLCQAIQSGVRSEFQTFINMNALLLRQVFLEADAHDLDMSLETSVIEDRGLLDQVQRLHFDTPSTLNDSSSVKNKTSKIEHQRQVILDLQHEQERLEGLVETLEGENQRLLEERKQDPDTDKSELRELRKTCQRQRTQLQEAQVQMSQSRQFQQLKALMTKKNQQLRECREKLLVYEPDLLDNLEDNDEHHFREAKE